MAKTSYQKLDYWSKKALSEGYPARSVYKLQEMDEKFKLIKPQYRILDLGAAPGSWTLYVLQKINLMGWLTAIDLSPLAEKISGKNLFFLQGDLFAKAIQDKANKMGPYDLIICDAAPATTGNKIVDTSRSESLVELAIYYTERMLKKNGNFVVKIFQGGGQQEIQKKMRESFNNFKIFKPKVCRSESNETYFLGFDKK